MKRALTVGLMVCLVAATSGLPADAKKKKKKKPVRVERVVEWKYEAPAFGTPDSTGVCFRPTNSCIDIAIGPDDLYIVGLEVTDATGTAVAVDIGQDTDPAAFGTEHTVGVVCGKLTEPLPLEPGAPIVGFPWAFGGAVCPGGIGTSGTIKVTLANMP